MQIFFGSRSNSIRYGEPSETAECKSCYGCTSYGLPICNDCYRELGARE